eukprot:4941355-Pyramimonas_sp.AAC.1
MESGSFSKCGSRYSAAHIHFNITRVSRVEGSPFSKCSSRLSAARIRLKHVQEFHGMGATHFHHVALVLAPRTFVLNICKIFTD